MASVFFVYALETRVHVVDEMIHDVYKSRRVYTAIALTPSYVRGNAVDAFPLPPESQQSHNFDDDRGVGGITIGANRNLEGVWGGAAANFPRACFCCKLEGSKSINNCINVHFYQHFGIIVYAILLSELQYNLR
jgi:hypothetical protein